MERQPEGSRRPSICFVAPNAYSAVLDDTRRHTGGAEVQQLLVARELQARGFPIRFITFDHGQEEGVEHGGIRVHRMCSRAAGVRGLRFFHPRWTSLWRALSAAASDVYYQRGAGCETGQVALWCRLHRRPFVFAAASGTDCQPSLGDLKTLRERFLYRRGLGLAARVVCQTSEQVDLFRRHFGVQGRLIRSCAEDPLEPGAAERAPPSGRPRLVWIGRFAQKKRFEWLLDLAERLPELDFDVAGDTRRTGDYAVRLMARAHSLRNVVLHGWVPHPRIGELYRSAALLLCTSPVEGYPNTYLEAWSRGIPVAGTVDPDGVVKARRLGKVGGSLPELEEGIRALIGSAEQWLEASRNGRRFYLENHSIPAAGDAYERLFMELSPPAPSRTDRYCVPHRTPL